MVESGHSPDPAASLITQVSRDGRPAMAPPPSPTTGSAAAASSSSAAAASSSSTAASAAAASSSGPGRKRMSFFQRLCCCCVSKTDGERGRSSSETQLVSSSQRRDMPLPPASVAEGFLLPPQRDRSLGRKCLVLDLDETLVHSSFKRLPNTDFEIQVEVEGVVHPVYVSKRPGVDEFLRRVGELFEVVVFTASLSKYADPVMDKLDIHKVVDHRLFREACSNHQGVYVKDMSRLGRDLKGSIIIDNAPTSYLFHPENAIPIGSWFDDMQDTELLDLIPFLEALAKVDDVTTILDPSNNN